MAAQSTKSKNSSLLSLAIVAVLVVGGSFLFLNSKNSNVAGPSASPTPKASAKPVASTQNTVSQSTVSSPVGRNLLSVKPGPKSGQATLSWTRYYSDYGKYSLVYGVTPGKYVYSVLNAGNSSSVSSTYSYTVGSLKSGTRYYFALQTQNNTKKTYISPEVSIVAR